MIVFDWRSGLAWLTCITVMMILASSSNDFAFWYLSGYLLWLSIRYPPIYWKEVDATN